MRAVVRFYYPAIRYFRPGVMFTAPHRLAWTTFGCIDYIVYGLSFSSNCSESVVCWVFTGRDTWGYLSFLGFLKCKEETAVNKSSGPGACVCVQKLCWSWPDSSTPPPPVFHSFGSQLNPFFFLYYNPSLLFSILMESSLVMSAVGDQSGRQWLNW